MLLFLFVGLNESDRVLFSISFSNFHLLLAVFDDLLLLFMSCLNVSLELDNRLINMTLKSGEYISISQKGGDLRIVLKVTTRINEEIVS